MALPRFFRCGLCLVIIYSLVLAVQARIELVIDLPDRLPANPVSFFEMESSSLDARLSEFVFEFSSLDSTVTHDMFLLRAADSTLLYYYANINTPVCIDNICKPVHIEVYLDLLGNYIGFGIFPDKPLTKYDHDLFASDDQAQLHQLLLDRHSILERRKLSDLFDPSAEPERQIEYAGQQVDAVSGATIREIKESVVEGALFSCYTLWHLVNGRVSRQLANQFQWIRSETLVMDFLSSSHDPYQFFAIKEIPGERLVDSLKRVMEIFSSSNSLVRSYLLKKIPADTWAIKDNAQLLYSNLHAMDINAMTLALKKLPSAHPTAFLTVADFVEIMTKNQLRLYLANLTDCSPTISAEVKSKLQIKIDQEEFTYAYLVQDYLH